MVNNISRYISYPKKEKIVKVENNINNKFKEQISKYDLKRDDKIEHHILSLEFEDNVINGLIIFKTFAVK